jgi:histidinol-phosphate aminotransferase
MKAEKKILIKTYPGVGNFGDCLRVSIGEQQYMERFTEALSDLDR